MSRFRRRLMIAQTKASTSYNILMRTSNNAASFTYQSTSDLIITYTNTSGVEVVTTAAASTSSSVFYFTNPANDSDITIVGDIRHFAPISSAAIYYIDLTNAAATLTSISFNSNTYIQQIDGLSVCTLVKTIPSNCFYNCTSLQYVDLPSEVETISSQAFYYCSSLVNTTMNIPSTCTSIVGGSTSMCFAYSSITKLIINSVCSIGARLALNSSLTTFVITATDGVCTLNDDYMFFFYAPTPKSVYVPDELLADYKAANKWRSGASYIYPISEYVNE